MVLLLLFFSVYLIKHRGGGEGLRREGSAKSKEVVERVGGAESMWR